MPVIFLALWQGARGSRSARNFLTLWQGARESRSARKKEPPGKGHERDGLPCGAHDSEGQHPCGHGGLQ